MYRFKIKFKENIKFGKLGFKKKYGNRIYKMAYFYLTFLWANTTKIITSALNFSGKNNYLLFDLLKGLLIPNLDFLSDFFSFSTSKFEASFEYRVDCNWNVFLKQSVRIIKEGVNLLNCKLYFSHIILCWSNHDFLNYTIAI